MARKSDSLKTAPTARKNQSSSADVTPLSPATESVEALEVWGEYAKDRCELQERRRAEFRGSARQLASVIAAVIGLEIASVGRFMTTIPNPTWRVGSTLMFILIVICQSLLLMRAIRSGFGGEKHFGPESPVTLHEHVLGKDKTEVVHIVSAYYAKSADTLHKLNENLISGIRKDALRFAALLFAAVCIPAVVVLLAPVHKENAPMTTQSKDENSQPPATPPSDSSPAQPEPSPPLETPTQGQLETAGGKPPKIKASRR